ncbi:MAG: hypothetical protein GYB65_22255 [Chloroflexi bacterium]|nr:hypothetical protein [Chloroflexota bacterium]
MIRRWMAALSTGYILMFFSEYLFVNVEQVTPALLLNAIPMLIAYTLAAYVFLGLLYHNRVRNIWALFLAGAAFGWLLEGVIVQTMYEAFPFFVPFTGLSWHALIDVLVGFWLVRKVLADGRRRSIVHTAILLGLFWSTWAIWTHWETGEFMPPGEFVPFAFVASLPLLPAYWLLRRTEPFQPQRYEWRVLLGLAVLMFVVVVVMIPYAVLVLPPLMWLILRALRRHRDSSAPATILITFDAPVHPLHYALLLLMPLVASVTYVVYWTLEVKVATNVLLYLTTVPLSVGMFVRAIRKLHREPIPVTPAENPDTVAPVPTG